MTKIRMAFDVPGEILSHVQFFAKRKRITLSAIATEALIEWFRNNPLSWTAQYRTTTEKELVRIAFNLPPELAGRLDNTIEQNNQLNLSKIMTAALGQWIDGNPLPPVHPSASEEVE